MIPAPLLPDWAVPAALVAWAFVSAHVQMVRQGRLKGPSIVTHFCGTAALAGIPFIEFFVPWHWCGGAKLLLIGTCFALMVLFMAVTKKSPAPSEPKRWRKTSRRGTV